ncbi:MAG: hypothetical protein Q4Q18_09405 [Methanobrevibacter sp.]|nr:hypothetical protein [Methanobrevibacter sp.]
MAKKEVSKNIKNFLKNSIQPKDCIAIVSDLKPSYDFIAYDAIENEKNVNISFNIIVK